MFTLRIAWITWLALSVELALAGGVASAEEQTVFPPAARQRYEQGRDLQKKGQLKEAIQSFEDAIQLGMDAYPRVHLQRANSNLDLKQYDKAIAQFTNFIEQFGLEESCRYWMRTAYSGRAAAYEKKGAYQEALADHNMVVLYHALETEILTGLETPDRGKFLGETADAYRARSKCLEALGRPQLAQVDRKRADGLETEAKKLARAAPAAKEAAAARIQVTNGYTEPLTLVVDGVSYRLDIGEQKAIPVTKASVAYEMQAGTHRKTGTLQAGKTYTIQASSR